MALKVQLALLRAIRDHPSAITLQVQSADRPEAAAEGLEAAAVEIAALDGGWQSGFDLRPGDRNGPVFLSGVMQTPSGPVLYIDGGHTPVELLATIPDIVVRKLQAVGVGRAVIAVPERKGPVQGLMDARRAVILRLYARPGAHRHSGAQLPGSWLEEAVAWVGAEPSGEQPLWVDVGQQFPMDARHTVNFLTQPLGPASAAVVKGDIGSRFRSLMVTFIRYQHLAIGGGGPGTSDADLAETFQELAEIARRLASQSAYSFIAIEPTFAMLASLNCRTWLSTPKMGGAVPEQVRAICDEVVLDGFPYQLLGAGHLARLSAAGVDLTTVPGPVRTKALEQGRWEVQVGNPSAWQIDSPVGAESLYSIDFGLKRRDPSVQKTARNLLEPCLVSTEEARAMVGRRS